MSDDVSEFSDRDTGRTSLVIYTIPKYETLDFNII